MNFYGFAKVLKCFALFKQNNRVQIRFFIYQIQSIGFMQTAVADLSLSENISRRIAQSLAFFIIVYAWVNKIGVDMFGVRNFLRHMQIKLKKNNGLMQIDYK